MTELLTIIANCGVLAPIYSFWLLGVYIVFFHQKFSIGKINVSALSIPSFWLLWCVMFVFSMIYPLIMPKSIDGNQLSYPASIVLYGLNPAFLFLAGTVIVTSSKNDFNEKIRHFICFIAIGCGVYVLLNVSVNIGRNRNQTVDFYRLVFRKNDLTSEFAATNQGSLNTTIFSLFPVLFITKNKLIKRIGLFLFVSSFWYALILGTRTQFVILIIVSLFVLTIYIICHYGGKIPRKRLNLCVFSVFFFVFFIVLLFSLNLFDIRKSFLNSGLAYRFMTTSSAESDSLRKQYLIAGFQSLLQYPFGFSKMTTSTGQNITFFHNYWLDLARVAGTIPFLCALFYNLVIFKHTVRIFKSEVIEEELRYALLCLNVGFLLNFFMEPILDGYIDFFYRFCLINGITEELYYKRINHKKK